MYKQGSRDWWHTELRKHKNSDAGGNNEKGIGTNLTANYITIDSRVPKTDQVAAWVMLMGIHKS